MNILPTKDALVGFRPEHFLPPGVAERMGEHISLRFLINHSEYLGAEKILYGVIDGGVFDDRKVISRIPSTHAEGLPDGSLQTFAVALRDLKFFDPKTGLRVPSRPLRSRA
jgi:multiple sugar transport system ATP-binding protein